MEKVESDLHRLALACSAFFIFGTYWALPLFNNDLNNAIWFVVQTMTTTGYGVSGEFWTPDLKAFSVCLMFVGVMYWTLFVGALGKYFWP